MRGRGQHSGSATTVRCASSSKIKARSCRRAQIRCIATTRFNGEHSGLGVLLDGKRRIRRKIAGIDRVISRPELQDHAKGKTHSKENASAVELAPTMTSSLPS